MDQTLRSTLLFAMAALASHAALAQDGIVQSPAYKECIALASSDPTKALAKADEWLTIDNGIAAHHCRAMALYGLKRFEEAGEALGSLRRSIPEENLTLRCFVTRQAVMAWKSANRADAALTILETQITELGQAHGNNAVTAKLTSELLVERAKLNLTYGKLNPAAADLDHAVSLTPLSTEALLTRAEAFEQLGDIPLARADVEAVLTLKPDDAKARAMLARFDEKAAPQSVSKH
jgi:tetratricopeptide (TPR) repeat protein